VFGCAVPETHDFEGPATHERLYVFATDALTDSRMQFPRAQLPCFAGLAEKDNARVSSAVSETVRFERQ
jgi:hypothetical protein